MARIPIYQDPQQLRTGNQTLQTPNLPAVTNASIGKAIGDASNVIFDISEKAKRANDVTKLTEASLAMNKAQMDFATFQQEQPDESKWLPKWQELQNGIKSRFDQEALSPDARLQLADRFSSWGTRGTINVQAQAFKQAGQRMDATVELAKRQSVETGDPTIAKQAFEARRAAGFSMKESDEVEYAQVLDAVKSKQIDSLKQQKANYIQAANNGDKAAWVNLAETNDRLFELGALDKENYDLATKQAVQGQLQTDILSQVNGSAGKVDITGARKMVDQYDILPDGVKEDLKKEIDRYEKQYGNEEILKAMDDLASGKLTAGAQFDSQYLRPAAVAEVRDAIDKARPPSPEDETEMYLGGMKAIENLDPELIKRNDPEESLEFVKVAAAIRRAPAHVRDRMADALRGKLSGGADVSANATAMRLARDTLSDILAAKKSDYFELKDGKQVIKPAKVGDWIKEQARIMSKENEFERRMKAIPNPTDKQYIETLNAVMGQDVMEARQKSYYKPAESGFEKEVPATSQHGYGPYRMDMPASGPYFANPLLPRP